MCMCGKPTINGQPGYSWDGKSFSTRPVNPPDLADGDVLLYDEAGRCGGLDCHAHHFRLVRNRSWYGLLVRHGGGDERIDLGCTVAKFAVADMERLDSNGRYWLLHTIYSVASDMQRETGQKVAQHWRLAAATGRIKTRKQRGSNYVKVWVEPEVKVEEAA